MKTMILDGNSRVGEAKTYNSVEEFNSSHELKTLKKLLVRSLEWVEHEYSMTKSFAEYCNNTGGDCLKCEIHKKLRGK